MSVIGGLIASHHDIWCAFSLVWVVSG